MGLIQSVEGLSRTKSLRKREPLLSGLPRARTSICFSCFQTQSETSTLPRCPAYQLLILRLSIHIHMSSFLIINFHMCLSIYLWSIPPILSLYMSTHAIGSVSLENPNMTNRFLLGFSTRNDEGHDVVRSRSEKWKKLKREVRMSQDHEEDSHTWEAAVNPSSRKQQVQRHQCVWTGRTERSSVADGGCACS